MRKGQDYLCKPGINMKVTHSKKQIAGSFKELLLSSIDILASKALKRAFKNHVQDDKN